MVITKGTVQEVFLAEASPTRRHDTVNLNFVTRYVPVKRESENAYFKPT